MSEPQPVIRYYWEDLPVGSIRELGQVTVKREEVIAFARQFDPQPFHLDDAAAAQTHFGRLAASGWHTCAMVMRLLVDDFLRYSSSAGSPGLEGVRWLKPVYPGDTLTVRQRIVESRPLKSRPGVGLIRSHLEAFNQHGEQVLLIDSYGMFNRRDAAAAN
ncbi:MAG: MaoC family dehydratase [Burkholderiaceae bacterium]|jgi:acyl dehydratase|nr:MaoC family dehydratase [Burkholderiaceae bacterium]